MQVWHHRPFWYGAHPVGRWTWRTGSRNDLRDVLDALDKLIALDHTLTATEETRSGWQVYLSSLRTSQGFGDHEHHAVDQDSGQGKTVSVGHCCCHRAVLAW